MLLNNHTVNSRLMLLWFSVFFMRLNNGFSFPVNGPKPEVGSVKRFISAETWNGFHVCLRRHNKLSRSGMKMLKHTDLPSETLYLLDGTALLHRCYFSQYTEERILPRSTEPVQVGGVLNFAERLANFLVVVKPRYVAISFDDTSHPTWRHYLFPEYKANRPQKPPDLISQLRMAPAVARALGIKTFCYPGYEADDLMATLTAWGRSVLLNVVVVSNDKDLYQLVRPRVLAMQPQNLTILGEEDVESKMGVRPEFLPDLLALMGDPPDNIPGVRGLGRVKCCALIQKYGNLEGIYTNLDDISSMEIVGAPRIKQKLITFKRQAFKYREMIKLVEDVPIQQLTELKSNELQYTGRSVSSLEMFRYLGSLEPYEKLQGREWDI